MKKIEVIFPPSRLNELREALAGLALSEFIVSDVRDVAPKNARIISYRGLQHSCDERSAFKLELMTGDAQATCVTEALSAALSACEVESKILVTKISEIAGDER